MVRSSRHDFSLWVDDRFRYPRVNAPVRLDSVGMAAPGGDGDAAIAGLRIFSPDPLRVNEEHTAAVVLPSGREVRCRVRVVWSGSNRSGGHEAGLKVIAAGDDLGEAWPVLEELAVPALATRTAVCFTPILTDGV